MLTSKFLTATLTALTVVGTAGLVFAQSTSTSDTGVQAQPATEMPINDTTRNTGTLNQGTGTLNQGTTSPGTGTLSQGTDTTNQGTGTMNQGNTTLGQGTDTMDQNRSMDQQLAARADRN